MLLLWLDNISLQVPLCIMCVCAGISERVLSSKDDSAIAI